MQHNIDSAKTNSTKPWMWFKIRTCAEETGQPQASYKKPQNMPSWKGPPRIAEYKPWPCTGHSNNPTLSLRALSKCSLSSGSLGAVTTRWGACSSAWPSSGGRTCSYYPSPSVAHLLTAQAKGSSHHIQPCAHQAKLQTLADTKAQPNQ